MNTLTTTDLGQIASNFDLNVGNGGAGGGSVILTSITEIKEPEENVAPAVDNRTQKFFNPVTKFPEGAPEGSIKCVFSTFNVVDRDGDVIAPDALKDGTPIKLCSWGHGWDRLAIGKGVIRTTKNEAIFEGQFNMNTEAGREAYETVKFMGDQQEWSWGFRIKEWERVEKDGKSVRLIKDVEPFEVSPVLIGANQQTGTLDIKHLKGETKAVASEDIEAILSQLAQMVSEAMSVDGARSYDADLLLAAMRALEWYLGDLIWMEATEEAGTDPEKIKELVRNYVRTALEKRAESLRDAGFTIVDESNEEQSTATFAGQGDRLRADLEAYVTRVNSLAELRAAQNRGWSEANAERLKILSDELESAAEKIRELLGENTEEKSEEEEQVEEKPAARKLDERRLRLAASRLNTIQELKEDE